MKVYPSENKLLEQLEASSAHPKPYAEGVNPIRRKAGRGGRSFSELMDEIYKEEIKRLKRNTIKIIKQENRALDKNLKKGCSKIRTMKNHVNKAS